MNELRIEIAFYRKGKFAGGSFAAFTGTEKEIRDAIGENGQLKDYAVGYMARLAGVRRYDSVTVCADTVKIWEKTKSTE